MPLVYTDHETGERVMLTVLPNGRVVIDTVGGQVEIPNGAAHWLLELALPTSLHGPVGR